MRPMSLTPINVVRASIMPNVSYVAASLPWRPGDSCRRPSSPLASSIDFSQQVPSAVRSISGFYLDPALDLSTSWVWHLKQSLLFSAVDSPIY